MEKDIEMKSGTQEVADFTSSYCSRFQWSASSLDLDRVKPCSCSCSSYSTTYHREPVLFYFIFYLFYYTVIIPSIPFLLFITNKTRVFFMLGLPLKIIFNIHIS